MSELNETELTEDGDLRNPTGEEGDAEADLHGDHLAKPTDVEYGDDDEPADAAG